MKLHLCVFRASFDIQKANNEWINSTYYVAEWIFLRHCLPCAPSQTDIAESCAFSGR